MLDERSKLDANLRLLIKHPQMHSAIRASWNMGLFFGRLKDFLVDGFVRSLTGSRVLLSQQF